MSDGDYQPRLLSVGLRNNEGVMIAIATFTDIPNGHVKIHYINGYVTITPLDDIYDKWIGAIRNARNIERGLQ